MVTNRNRVKKGKVQAHLAHLKSILTTNRQATFDQIVQKLNPVIWGWANYYRHVTAKETFGKPAVAFDVTVGQVSPSNQNSLIGQTSLV